jgi:dTDP-glucose 4,6-dehydratase
MLNLSGKTILVTGGCGFIGSNFINYILDKYNNVFVINIDKLDYNSDVNNVKHTVNYKFIKCNINNKDLVLNLFEEYDINIVVNFAAQTHVDNSFIDSIAFTKDNILGTHILIECARIYGKLDLFLHFSTDEVYGEIELNDNSSTEKSLLNPTNPYAATKAGAEFMVKSYNYSFNLPVIITRCNNVYGPNQYPEKLIPKFINTLLNNEKCTVHGNGENRRTFIFTDDVSRAVEIILTKGEIMKTYNIGTNNEHSVLDITKYLVKQMKNSDNYTDWIKYVADRNFNDFRYSVDTSLLEKLGWKEETLFSEGLVETIEWYKQQHDKNKKIQ